MSLRSLVWGVILGLFVVSLGVSLWPLNRELFVSPDENAAYVFAKHFSSTGNLVLPEPLNETLGGILHPRSTIGFGNSILPASFIGLVVLAGAVGAVFGFAAMQLVTPLFAVIAVVLWRDTVKRLFAQDSLADLAAIFLLIHPAFWYYTGRAMMHNVVFLTLLIAGTWWLVTQPLANWVKKTSRPSARLGDFLVAGMLVGSSLIVRTSELLWVSAALALGLIIYRTVIGWRALAMCGLGFGLSLGLLAILNGAVYGAPLVNGYTVKYPFAQMTTAPTPDDVVASPAWQTGGVIAVLLPFGFHEYNIFTNVINYGWKLYPWMSLLAIFGALIAYTQHDDRRWLWRGLVWFTLGLAVWLGLVYGSWRIVDNPDPSIISLGNSHVRYWLPIFAVASIFCARTIVYILDDRSWWRQLFAYGLVAVTTLLSLHLVMFGHDGFVFNRSALESFAIKREAILTATDAEAVIIVDRADKYVFPERRVLVPLRSDQTYASLPTLLQTVPVYYFGITLPQSDLDYLNTQKLQPLNVQIELVQTLQDESLYRFLKN